VVILILSFFFDLSNSRFGLDRFHFIIIQKLLLVLLGSILSQISFQKNGLSKDSSYTIFFYFFISPFFPVLDNINLVFANLFILLALRRLIFSPKSFKEKIFDAFMDFVAAFISFFGLFFI
jgi:amino acid permease